MTYGKKLSHKPVSHTINTTILEDNYNETKITNNLIGVSFKTKNEIKKQINGILEVLKKYKNTKLTDKIKKELDIKLKEFNNYIRNISLNTSNFSKIQDLINVFRADYYNVVGIKRDEKEDITAENAIGLFELFEVEKKVEETNEQSKKSSSGTGTETGSSTSSDNCKMKETKETKSKDDTTLTTSGNSENEMKEKQSDPAEMPVFSEEDKKSKSNEEEKSKSSSCSSARSDLSMTNNSESDEEYTKTKEETEEKITKEEQVNQTITWKDVGKDTKYTSENINGGNILLKPNAQHTSMVTHKQAQEQVYQIAYSFVNKIKESTFKVEENTGKTLVISDTHGDMGALLEALLRSGVVEFMNKDNPCKVIKDISNPDNKIIIPNLKLKEECNNKLMILGDIIDRGFHSDSCMMLMKDIQQKQKQQESKNVIFIVGNHEDMVIKKNSILDLYTIDNNSCLEKGNNKDYNTARHTLMSAIENDEMVFCYYDESSNTIYSHVPFDVDNTVKALDFLLKDGILNKIDNILLKQENIEILKNKIQNNTENLNTDEVKNLVCILNELYKYNCVNKNKELENVFCVGGFGDRGGLLWNRDYKSQNFKAIKGVNFVGGHDIGSCNIIKSTEESNIKGIDCGRSYFYKKKVDGNNVAKTSTSLIEIKKGETEKIKATKLKDVNKIIYSDDYTEIKTINNIIPEKLTDDKKFDVIDVNAFLDLITIEQVFETRDGFNVINQNNLKKYLQQNNFSKESLGSVILNDKFKDVLLVEYEGSINVNDFALKNYFIDPILNEYKKTHDLQDDVTDFIKRVFDVLNDSRLNLTTEQKNKLKEVKKNYLEKEGIKETVEETTGRIILQDNFLIGEMELRNKIKKLADVVKIIDRQLSKYNNEEKKQVLQNTIDLIKEQKEQLKNDNKKLQKAAILLVILEVYKYYMDKTNNFNSVNEVYKMLNDTIKKKIKKITLSTTEEEDLSSVIDEINGVLNKKNKEQINGVNISF